MPVKIKIRSCNNSDKDSQALITMELKSIVDSAIYKLMRYIEQRTT